MGLYGLFRIILIALAVWWLYKLLKRWLAKDDKPQPAPSQPRAAAGDGKIEVMVQDPFCGTYIPQSEAITSRIAGKRVNFCSEKCRQGYLDALENTRKKEKRHR